MKKFMRVLIAGILVVSMLAGCSKTPASKTEPGSNGSNKENKVITIRLWGGVPPEAGPQQSVDDFNAAFKDKGIQAEYERFVNDDTGNLKLETSLLAGTDVDLYISYIPATLQKRASGNMALDLSELIERDKFDLIEKYGSMVESFYIDGKPYSIPTKLDQYGMVLNKDMFDAAGIPIPTEWTFDEFREISKQLTSGEGQDKVYGMFWNTQQDLMYGFNYLSVQTLGGDPLYSADGKQSNIADPVNLKSIELMYNTMNVDKSAPTHTDSVTQKLSQEGMFLSGKSAMTIGPWIVRSIKDKTTYPHDFETAFAPYPVVEKGQRLFTQGGYGDHLCINPKSQNIDAAWEFAKWYATEGMLPVVEGGRIPAANTYNPDDVVEAFLKGGEDHIDGESAKRILILPYDNYAVPAYTKKLPEIRKIVQEELEEIFTEQKSVEQGLNDAQTRANDQLNK